jgi:hypothetical protein
MSREELAAEAGTALPPKEVLSLLDLNVDADIALDLAAPIDLAVAANANVAAPIDAAVSGNILSALSNAASMADQDAAITQTISGEANADAPQTSVLDQSDDVGPSCRPTPPTRCPAACSTSTSTWPSTPTSRLPSLVRWRPTPTWRLPSMRPSQPTSARSALRRWRSPTRTSSSTSS